MPLSDCIRKAGKALSTRDATAIQTLADDFEASGMLRQEAELKAIEQHVGMLQGEIDAMLPSESELAQKQGYEGQDKQEASRWARAVAKGLDVSPEARKQRAREQGYDVDTKLYHGTGAVFDSLSTEGVKGGRSVGAFLTSSPDVAITYSSVGGKEPNVIPVYAKLQNPLVIDAKGANWNGIPKDTVVDLPSVTKQMNEEAALLAELTGEPVQTGATTRAASSDTLENVLNVPLGKEFVDTNMLSKFAKQYGYDGLVIKNVVDRGPGIKWNTDESNKSSDVTVVFDPSQVRSVHAAFDPDETASGDLLAQSAIQTESPEFKNWFGDSKVVDAEGKPLVMYHGTTKSFNVFDTKTYGALLGKGAYFTSDKEDARQYSGEGVKGVTPRIVETYIKVQNPYEVSTVLGSVPKQDELIAQGYDGIIRRNAEGGVKWAVAFEPTQIKSAIGNKGTFDPNDPNILNQTEGNLPRGTTLMNPDEPVISLSTASDMSTFLHETMHLFMLMEQQFAKEFGITPNQRALLESVGVESFDQLTREHHEQLAESFEVYLREGKAPSVKLMDAFNTFRAWLLQVYKSLRNLPNQKLDDKMRAAFDRLLATEEEIQQAAASPAFMQMFRTKEQAGMTDAEWKAYQEAKAKRDGRAITTIEEKIIRQLKQRKTKEWKQERDVLAREEEARLAELPVYKILANTLKRTDDDMARPLDRKSIESILGVKNVTGAWIRRTSNDGTDPQLVSEAYGYATVEDMVQEMNEALPIREAAIEAAEARMKEKYGDILNDGTMEAEVMTALHNVKDVDKLYAELRALDSTQTLNRDLLKAEARRIIGTMKNSEIRPSKFHQNMIRAAQRAATSGSKAEKVMAKQQQLVNHYLYKEAVKAKQEADKFTKYVNKVKTRKYNTRQVAPEYVHTMKMLAKLYTTKSKTTDADIKELVEFFSGQEAAMKGVTLLDPQIAAAVAAAKEGTIEPIMMKNMTMAELQGLYLQLKNLRFVGGRESEARAEEFKQQMAALTKSVNDNGGPDRPEFIAPGPFDKLTKNISGFLKSLPSLRNFMRWLDGGNDYGEAFKQIYRPIEDANNNKMRMHRELYERFEAELSQIDQVSLKRYGAKKVTLDDGRVVPIHGEARFMIALYWGTESSREAIRQGHRYTDNDVARIMADMSKPELELLNAVWRLNESIWPDIAAAHQARTGVLPPKLEPTPFIVNGVELTGGHMRLYYLEDGTNPTEFSDAKPGEFDSLITRKSGTMIERVGSGGRKVLLDKGNITRAINDAIHYTAFANPSVELERIMNNDEFQGAIRLKHGDVFYNQLVETMRSVVTNKKDRDVAAWLADGARYLRRNLTAMHLMYSIRNVVQQVTALPLVMEEVGPVNFVKSLLDFVVPGNEHVKFVNDSSEFMRNRAELVNREAHEQLHNIAFGGPVTRGLKTLNDYGFFMQTTVDSVFAYPTWKAKYEAEMMKHGDHKIAVSQADTAVAESVGSGADLHLGSAYQQSRSEFMKSMTQFGSFFNSVLYQRMKRAQIRGSARGMTMALVAQPILLGVIAAVVTADMPEEEEDWNKWFFKNWGSQLAGMYIGIRDIFAVFQGFNKRGIIQGGASAPAVVTEKLIKISEGENPFSDAAGLTRGVGMLVPLPGAGQVARVLDYMDSDDQNLYEGIVEGKQRNE